MVMTPVGARCRTCANVRPMAMYEVKPELLLRGLLAGVVSALIGAAIFLFFLRAFIFFTSFFYGFIVAQAIEYASNRKRGPTMQILGVACVLLGAFGALFLGGFLMGGGSPATAMLAVMSVFRGDLLFFLFVAIASVIVWNRLS
jgi:hypothetical protein